MVNQGIGQKKTPFFHRLNGLEVRHGTAGDQESDPLAQTKIKHFRKVVRGYPHCPGGAMAEHRLLERGQDHCGIIVLVHRGFVTFGRSCYGWCRSDGPGS